MSPKAGRPLNVQEQELLELLARGVLNLSPVHEKHSMWLLAVHGAAITLLLGHLGDLRAWTEKWTLVGAGASLFLALVAGLIARIDSVSTDFKQATEDIPEKARLLAAKHGDEAPHVDVDAKHVLDTLKDLLPSRAQKQLLRQAASRSGDPNAPSHAALRNTFRSVFRQQLCLAAQYLLTLVATVLIAASLALRLFCF